MIPRYVTISKINGLDVVDLDLHSPEDPEEKVLQTLRALTQYVFHGYQPLICVGTGFIELKSEFGTVIRREFDGRKRKWGEIKYMGEVEVNLTNVVELITRAVKENKKIVVKVVSEEDSDNPGVFVEE